MDKPKKARKLRAEKPIALVLTGRAEMWELARRRGVRL